MTKASDNEFPSVLLDEQASAPTTPATGFWRVYAKSDGLYIVDDAGSETGPFGTGGAGGGSAVTFDINRYEAGDITVSATVIGTALHTSLDLTLAASSGDTIEVGLAYSLANNPEECRIDFATRVLSADVTYFSSGDGTSAGGGIQGLNTGSTANANKTSAFAAIPLVLGAGDIDTGNVTVRIYAWRNVSNATVNADADRPVIAWMKNYGQ